MLIDAVRDNVSVHMFMKDAQEDRGTLTETTIGKEVIPVFRKGSIELNSDSPLFQQFAVHFLNTFEKILK